MRPIRIRRPDLQEEVRELIDLICHTPDGSGIPLMEVIRVLGIRMSEAFTAQVEARGDLVLNDDRFENGGPEVNRTVRMFGFEIELVIAEQLTGQIMRFSDSFNLAFDADHSVSASKFLFRLELRHLDFSTERVFVEFNGAQDVFIELQ